MQDVGEAQSDIFKTWPCNNSAGQMHFPERVGLDQISVYLNSKPKRKVAPLKSRTGTFELLRS